MKDSAFPSRRVVLAQVLPGLACFVSGGLAGCFAPTQRRPHTGVIDTGDAGSTETGLDETGLTETGDTADTALACDATGSDIEGPYYREGLPTRAELDLYGDEGQRLTLTGVVKDESCQPVEGVVVEIWHADDEGEYDTETEEMRYYGKVITDAEGRYGFHTLMPGHYLNGSTYRPAHLHIKVWVKGEERLTTQLYFEGDPFNETDAWFDAARALALTKSGDEFSSVFDFVV